MVSFCPFTEIWCNITLWYFSEIASLHSTKIGGAIVTRRLGFFVLCVCVCDKIHMKHSQSHNHSQTLQPMQGLGRLKKSPLTISILGLDPPNSDSQPLCIPRHSIHPSEVWPSHSPSALRTCPRWFSYTVDYLAFVLYILPIWAWLS